MLILQKEAYWTLVTAIQNEAYWTQVTTKEAYWTQLPSWLCTRTYLLTCLLTCIVADKVTVTLSVLTSGGIAMFEQHTATTTVACVYTRVVFKHPVALNACAHYKI